MPGSIICINCGEEIDQDCKFCSYCSSEIKDMSTEVSSCIRRELEAVKHVRKTKNEYVIFSLVIPLIITFISKIIGSAFPSSLNWLAFISMTLSFVYTMRFSRALGKGIFISMLLSAVSIFLLWLVALDLLVIEYQRITGIKLTFFLGDNMKKSLRLLKDKCTREVEEYNKIKTS